MPATRRRNSIVDSVVAAIITGNPKMHKVGLEVLVGQIEYTVSHGRYHLVYIFLVFSL